MSFFDFFFPEQAQAAHLRNLVNAQRSKGRRESRAAGAANRRLDELEENLGFVSLVLAALLQTVDEKGVLTREEVRAALEELDEMDGVRDGRLDIAFLRGWSK